MLLGHYESINFCLCSLVFSLFWDLKKIFGVLPGKAWRGYLRIQIPAITWERCFVVMVKKGLISCKPGEWVKLSKIYVTYNVQYFCHAIQEYVWFSTLLSRVRVHKEINVKRGGCIRCAKRGRCIRCVPGRNLFDSCIDRPLRLLL